MVRHLYIHVPFCKTICAYCDFCHRVYNREYVLKWLDSLRKEISLKCHDSYETIYIGGGTPTSLNEEELETLLKLIKPYSGNVIEYTIEVNPESLTAEKVALFKSYGINRISMGIQTTDEGLLKVLNRHHSFEDVKEKISLLKDNGLNNISVDLMYSLPFQTMDILEKSINDVLSLDLPHISIYSLIIEENTIFEKKGYRPLDEDTEADMYDCICERLTDAGYRHYEVSNFAKEGFESKHNLGYWRYDDYLGVSMAAASKVNHIRYENTHDFERYFNDVESYEEYIELSREDEMFENVMMSLRTAEGLDLVEFKKRYGEDALDYYRESIEKQKDNLIIDNNHLICRRLEILNNILLDFMK